MQKINTYQKQEEVHQRKLVPQFQILREANYEELIFSNNLLNFAGTKEKNMKMGKSTTIRQGHTHKYKQ